jgi:phage-related tail fiber protein
MINSQYSSVITSAGHTANIQSKASGTIIVFDEIAFGSGGLVPNENATGLIKEELRIKIHSVVQNQTDTNILEIEAVVPAHIGGFTINEAAIYLDDGTLYAVASLPESYKPNLDQGAGKEFSFVFFLASVGVENVALTIDGGASFVTTNNFQNELKKYAFVTGDETKKFKVADAQTENEAVNKKQIDELELRLNDSIETINDLIETIKDSVGKNTTTAITTATKVVGAGYMGEFGQGLWNTFNQNGTFTIPNDVSQIRVRVVGAGGGGRKMSRK